MFEPVEKKRVSDQIIEKIRERILNGELKPGEKLPSERELAKIFNVTRIPIREALKALEKMGFIEINPGGGSIVRDIFGEGNWIVLPYLLAKSNLVGGELLKSILEFRVLVGAEMAEKAVLREGKLILDDLKRIFEEEKKIKQISKLQELDLKFFDKLAIASGNLLYKFLINFIADFYIQNQDIFEDLIVSRDFLINTHNEIILAIENKDEEQAKRAAKTYLEKGMKKLLEDNNE